MNNQLQKLEERIKKLEENQINTIMSFNADSNVYRSIQRSLNIQPLAIGKPSPVNCALLEISSITKGLVFSRMTTTQRNAIVNPVAGLIIYNTSSNKLNVYTTGWEVITSA